MNKLPLKLMLTVVAVSVFYASQVYTQESPTTYEATRLRITQGPEIERVDPDFAIITWTSNNPRGSPEHYAIVRYGTNPTKLNQTAKSPIRLNPSHSHIVFRVRMDNLKPRTTYYYTVDSMGADGKGDGVETVVKHFTTPY